MQPAQQISSSTVVCGDALETVKRLPENSVQTVVTSPPYWGQRDYGTESQIGVEEAAQEYVDEVVTLFAEIGRVLKDTGSLWVNLDDTYNGCSIIRQVDTSHHPRKGDSEYEKQLAENRDESGVKRRSSSQWDLRRQSRMFIPSRIARRLCEDHDYRLRDRVVWVKPRSKPEGRVSTRLQQSHETIYRFVRSESAIFHDDSDVQRDVWKIPTASNVNHPAPFPEEIPRRAIELTSGEGDVVLDPFCGSGTTLAVAKDMGREWVGIDCHERFVKQSRQRLEGI